MSLLGSNPNRNRNPNHIPQPTLNPISNPNPVIHLKLHMGPQSALYEDHETGVASALVTSQDRPLTLAKALSPCGINFKSDNSTHEIDNQCRNTRYETWKFTMSFANHDCSCMRGFLRPTCRIANTFFWPWNPSLMLTGTLLCVVHSALQGDN